MTPKREQQTIRDRRKGAGLKQVELAKLAGIPPSQLSAIEGGYGSSKPAEERVLAALEEVGA